MSPYLVYFFVFVMVVLLTSAIGSRLTSGVAAKNAVNRRMQMLSETGEGLRGLESLRLERGLRSDGTLGETFAAIRLRYLQSGVVIGWRMLLLYAGLAGSVIGFIAARASGLDLVGLLVFLAILAAGPFVYLSFMRNRRIAAFAKQLPDTIDVIVRSLQAGHPLTTSLGLVASEMPDPVGSEFGILNDEITYGTEMDRALQNLAIRVPADDLAMFAMTIMIQRQTGGNLAEILQSLSSTIRERQMLKLKIKSLTAEGRFSAVFMTFFPFLIYGVVKLLAPDYFDPLWDSGYGNIVFGGCIVTILIGNVIMRRMVNFRV